MPVDHEQPGKARLHDAGEHVAEVAHGDLGSQRHRARPGPGLAGAGGVRRGGKEHGAGRTGGQFTGEPLGEQQVGAERQVRTVPLDGTDRQHREVGRLGHGGQRVAGYPGDGQQSALGLPPIDQFVHCSALRVAVRLLSSRPENHITTKISATWSMP